MRYIWAIIWSLLLFQMIFYVLANMNGAEYSIGTAIFMGLVVAAFVVILAETTISDSNTDH